jgi:predicted PurR-regulated permease PerM
MFRKVEISHKTIIFSVLFILSLGLLYLLKDLILELFVALLLMVILDPIVARLSRFKIPRVIAVLLTYVFVIGSLVGVVSLILPAVVEQTGSFIEALPGYLSNIGISREQTSGVLQGFLNSNAGTASGAIFQFTFSVVGNVVGIFTVLVFAFYMLMSRDKMEDQLGLFFGEDKKRELGNLLDTLEKKLGGWARGQLILMLVIGITTYIGLKLIGIPYTLPLAILAGLLEVVPFLGPIIAAVPSVIIGFGISPITGVGVAALVFLIQQLESYVLVPKVMQRSVGVSPLITLIALAVGARLAGIVGAIISVPVLITLQVIANKYLIKEDS